MKKLGLLGMLILFTSACNSGNSAAPNNATNTTMQTPKNTAVTPPSNNGVPTATASNTQPAAALSPAVSPETYTTSTGAIFTKVQGPGGFGIAWRDPSGAIWSKTLGYGCANTPIKQDQNKIVTDSAATEACNNIGGNLPTALQYQNLGRYFERVNVNGFLALTDQGRKDLYAVFTDMTDKPGVDLYYFWTSSVYPSGDSEDWNDFAYTFESYNGAIEENTNYSEFRETANFVRCVSR